jgi:hypothetical protein
MKVGLTNERKMNQKGLLKERQMRLRKWNQKDLLKVGKMREREFQ